MVRTPSARPRDTRTKYVYFALGVAVAAGLASLFTPLSSVFLTSGVAPGFVGEVTGEADGLATGVAVAVADGVAGGLGESGFCGSQAPNTAVETAKTDVNINDLLIVFSLLFRSSITIWSY